MEAINVGKLANDNWRLMHGEKRLSEAYAQLSASTPADDTDSVRSGSNAQASSISAGFRPIFPAESRTASKTRGQPNTEYQGTSLPRNAVTFVQEDPKSWTSGASSREGGGNNLGAFSRRKRWRKLHKKGPPGVVLFSKKGADVKIMGQSGEHWIERIRLRLEQHEDATLCIIPLQSLLDTLKDIHDYDNNRASRVRQLGEVVALALWRFNQDDEVKPSELNDHVKYMNERSESYLGPASSWTRTLITACSTTQLTVTPANQSGIDTASL